MEASCGVLQIEIEKNEQIEIQDLFFKIVLKMIFKNLQLCHTITQYKKNCTTSLVNNVLHQR